MGKLFSTGCLTMSEDSPKKPPVLNLANQLTLSRLVLSVALFVLIEYELWTACLIVFGLAALTDWLDGVVARRYNLGSALGRILDPLVDKVIICGSYIFLITKDNTGLAAWMVVIVVSREFLITGLRGFLEQKGTAFGADLWGKLKMVLQCAALVVIFLVLIWGKWTDMALVWWETGRDILIGLMVIVTALSGLNYCWQARNEIRT